MAARKYGSDALKDRDPVTGQLPPEDLTDAEIAHRISEKIQLQAQMSRERGTRITGAVPTAKPIEPAPKAADPAEQAALAAELAQAQADLAALEAAEKEAKRQEQAIADQADRERKDRRQALIDHADSIRARVAEVEARARAAKLQELASEHAAAPQRNAQRVDEGLEAKRQEMRSLFDPILAEIGATMREANHFVAEHGQALEKLAAQTFSTTDTSFPIRVRQKLSAEVYRPAERLLDYINTVRSCSTGYGNRWDQVLTESIQHGKLTSPEGMALTIQYAKACNREHVEAWKRELAQITSRLEQLTAQGKAEASAPPQITITIDDTARHERARDARLGSLTSSRPTQAVTGPILD